MDEEEEWERTAAWIDRDLGTMRMTGTVELTTLEEATKSVLTDIWEDSVCQRRSQDTRTMFGRNSCQRNGTPVRARRSEYCNIGGNTSGDVGGGSSLQRKKGRGREVGD